MREESWTIIGILIGIPLGFILGWLFSKMITEPLGVMFERDAAGRIVGIYKAVSK